MGIVFSVTALLVASVACGLSVAVALRVKKLLDPLTEEGVLNRRRGAAPEVGTVVPRAPFMVNMDGNEVAFPAPGSDPWVLSFQSVGCSGCKQQLPTYKKFLSSTGLGEERVFSLVIGEADGVAFYRDELSGFANVIPVDGQDSTLALMAELGVSVFPTYLIVDGNGRVKVSSQSSAGLTQTSSGYLAPISVGS
ncbi:hypothetical protein AB0J81_18000 [Streptomyces bobili]|uniref:TlpA family protein disulfide reductase n=1 Tax=Streptomyces bobili TaxID=67280 RepID=UPI00341FFC45